jgi:hypothetical protein
VSTFTSNSDLFCRGQKLFAFPSFKQKNGSIKKQKEIDPPDADLAREFGGALVGAPY